MTIRSTLYVLCAVAACAATARAQAPTAAPARPQPAGGFFLGAGLDPLSHGFGTTQSDVALQGGYERRLGTSRFGLRLEGNYWRHRSRYTQFSGLGATQVVTAMGAGLVGTYQFAPTARVRPYALGGLGMQQYAAPAETDRTADGIVYAYNSHRRNLLAYTAGAGLDVPVGRAALFVEGRVIALPGASGLAQSRTTPLTVGLRF